MGSQWQKVALNHLDLQRASVQEQAEISGIALNSLEVHRTLPGSKPTGVCWILYKNANGIDCRSLHHPKIIKARQIHDELESDVVAYNEHQINFKHKDIRYEFNHLFCRGEADICSVVAHNTHENMDRIQEGGTAVLVFGPMTQHLDLTHAKDASGLGRWVVTTFRGANGLVTHMVCGYKPCGNSKLNSGTVYQQHRRFLLMQRHSMICPRVKFREDLIQQLTEWRDMGDRLIVCLDANKDIYKKSLGKALTSPVGLATKEVVGEFTGKKLGATYFRWSKHIDGICVTSDVTIASACMMPVGFGIGDHRLFVINVLVNLVISVDPVRVVQPQAQWLNTKIPGALRKYNDWNTLS